MNCKRYGRQVVDSVVNRKIIKMPKFTTNYARLCIYNDNFIPLRLGHFIPYIIPHKKFTKHILNILCSYSPYSVGTEFTENTL